MTHLPAVKIFQENRGRGFTLVELLVVIGIISILVAVSFPILTIALARARTVQCGGNLHSIGTALLAYAGDHDGDLPEAGGYIPYDTVDGTTGQNGWTQQIEPYLKTKEVFKCPDSSALKPRNATYNYFLGAHAAYAANHNRPAAVNLMKVSAASQLILAGDIAFNNFMADDADKDDYTQDPAFNGNSGKIPIHRGTVNILFVDGHIENLNRFDKNTITTRYDGPGFDYLSTP